MGTKHYLRPREKLARQGAAALSDAELLQAIIGSGVLGVGVEKISRRILSLLHKINGSLSYHQLIAVGGIGPARASMLLAVFELAARYPRRVPLIPYDDAYRGRIHRRLRKMKQVTTVYVLLDAGGNVITHRYIDALFKDILQQIMTDLTDERVARVVICTGYDNMPQYPDYLQLTVSRAIHRYAKLCGIVAMEEWVMNARVARKMGVYG